MKINKDLVDAVMMISFISLVLIGTSDFSNETTKDIFMAILGVITLAMVGLRFIKPKNKKENELAD